MVIVTLQSMGTIGPVMSVHGGIIKLDLGALVIEMDKESFKNLVADLTNQAENLKVYDY